MLSFSCHNQENYSDTSRRAQETTDRTDPGP